MDWLTTQEIILNFVSSFGGTLSFVLSAIMITMILRSTTKLSKPLRRIIFGMTVFDLILSISDVTSSLPSPSGMSLLAVGNEITCTFQGAFVQLGVIGSVFYNTSLAIYYLCVVRFNLRDKMIVEKIEPFLHAVPTLLATLPTTYLIIKKYFNFIPSNNCWISPQPYDCIHNPDIECTNGEHAYSYTWLFMGFPLLAALFVNVIIMLIIIWTMMVQAKKNNSYRLELWRVNRPIKVGLCEKLVSKFSSSWRSSSTSLHQQQQQDQQGQQGQQGQQQLSGLFTVETQDRRGSVASVNSTASNTQIPMRNSTKTTNKNTNPISMSTRNLQGSNALRRNSHSNLDQRRNRNRNRSEEQVITQSVLFILSFLATYLFSVIYHIYLQQSGNVPFCIAFLARLTSPLQGVFHILVYTRPHIISLRRRNQNYTWMKAFWMILQKGGDSDEVSTGRGRRRSSCNVSSAEITSTLKDRTLFRLTERIQKKDDIIRNSSIPSRRNHPEYGIHSHHHHNGAETEKSKIDESGILFRPNTLLSGIPHTGRRTRERQFSTTNLASMLYRNDDSDMDTKSNLDVLSTELELKGSNGYGEETNEMTIQHLEGDGSDDLIFTDGPLSNDEDIDEEELIDMCQECTLVDEESNNHIIKLGENK